MPYEISDWTDERVAELTRLWLEGWSAGQIMRKLGGTTRNAVIGKINRLKLQRAPQGPRQPRVERTYVKAAPAPVAPTPEPEEPQTDGVPMLALEYSSCRWPLWQLNGAPNFHHCGATKMNDGSYCAFHAKRAFSRQQVTPEARERSREARKNTGIARSFG